VKRSSQWENSAKNASGHSENDTSVEPERHDSALMTHIFFHPDYTVGPGISPDLLTLQPQALAGSVTLLQCDHTAGGELHPAPKT